MRTCDILKSGRKYKNYKLTPEEVTESIRITKEMKDLGMRRYPTESEKRGHRMK